MHTPAVPPGPARPLAAGSAAPETASHTRADRPLTVHVLVFTAGAYAMAGQTTLQAIPSPYGFTVGKLDYVPLAMSLWGERDETLDAMAKATIGILAVRISDLNTSRLLPRSGFVQQFVRSSLLASIDDTLVRARKGRVALGFFDYAEVDESFPIIMVAAATSAMEKIRRRALEVHTGEKPATLQFE